MLVVIRHVRQILLTEGRLQVWLAFFIGRACWRPLCCPGCFGTRVVRVDRLGVLEKDVRVVGLVVVVVKLHDASIEGVVRVQILRFILVEVHLHLDRFLQHLGRLHDRVGEQFPEVLHTLDSLELLIGLQSCLNVGISSTLLDRVPDFFAAGTAHILIVLDVSVRSIRVLLILIFILRLVRAVPAPKLVLPKLPAAPPHLTAV